MNPPAPPIALTHRVPDGINRCELTFLKRQPIDIELARSQHADYRRLLAELGLRVIELDVNRDHPDAVFVEDTAVVLDEVAILARPGAESRRGEVDGIAPILAGHRPLAELPPDATLEGGDVVVSGREILVGQSRRTNQAGATGLAELTGRYSYRVRTVPVRGCLHLKSACTSLGDNRLLVNQERVPAEALTGFQTVPVPVNEPDAANCLRVGETVLVPSCFPETASLLRTHGLRVEPVVIDELRKAEAGLTCCSLIFRPRHRPG
jgi:dimethylargininase